MSEAGLSQDQNNFEQELQIQAEELVELIKRGDMATAMLRIQQLNELRHQALYHEVGCLTRAVHNAIISFTDDVSSTELLRDSKHHIASISDASDRLSYVIELTESNAHNTIDQVDESLRLVETLELGFQRRKALLDEFAQVKEGQPRLEQLYEKACTFAEDHSDALNDLKERLQGIMVAQEYQDITGQLIKRVIQLVTDIEHELVDLMEVAARVNRLGAIQEPLVPLDSEEPSKASQEVKAEGPQMASKGKTEIASNQDEVDDLLSSLGF